MKLRVMGANQTELEISPDLIVFFSYNTPVACWYYGRYYRTAKKHSKTTSRHINDWLESVHAEETKPQPQEWFDHL
jgi:hypothetical protein